MSTNPMITIQFRDASFGPVPQYAPGDPVHGQVLIQPDRDLAARHVYIRLQWRTEGRGDTDKGVIGQLDVFQGTLSASYPATYPFAFTLPNAPWSYSGHYISIVWEIAVEIDVALRTNPKAAQPLVLALAP